MADRTPPLNDTNDHAAQADAVAHLDAAPERFARMITGLSKDAMTRPGADGGQSVTEILWHMQDWDEINADRVWQMRQHEVPTLPEYDDALWTIEHDYASRDADTALDAFRQSRATLVRMVTGADLTRTGVLGQHGTVSIGWLVDRILQHDAKHIEDVGQAIA